MSNFSMCVQSRAINKTFNLPWYCLQFYDKIVQITKCNLDI